jgi:putative endonuclease
MLNDRGAPALSSAGVSVVKHLGFMKTYAVYILTNVSRSTLYTGISGKLLRRVFQHKYKEQQGFTARYNVSRLVYYENYSNPLDAIAREKEIKGWRRQKKIALVESMNPKWDDLAREWENIYKAEKPRSFAPVSRAGSPLATQTARGQGQYAREPSLAQDDIRWKFKHLSAAERKR